MDVGSISLMCFQSEFLVDEIFFYCNSDHEISTCLVLTYCDKNFSERFIGLDGNTSDFPPNHNVTIGSVQAHEFAPFQDDATMLCAKSMTKISDQGIKL